MLTDTKLRALKREPTPGKYTDGQGLYLRVTPAGGLYWQWRIRTPRETIVSYGTYPEVSLGEARQKHREAQSLRRSGTDPNAAKRASVLALRLASKNTFGAISREWLDVQASKWSSSHLQTTRDRIRRDLTPFLEDRAITELDVPELLQILRKIEARGAGETAHRVRFILSQVFTYAVATGQAKSNPAADLSGTLLAVTEGHHAAITDPAKLGQLIRDIQAYRGSPIVRTALLIHALTFQRPGEIRGMRWSELDLNGGVWLIGAERMKSSIRKKAAGEPHFVPLSDAAANAIREIEPLTGRGRGDLVFPGQRGQNRSISENTCRQALRTLGYSNEDHTPHGFRATARTLIDEKLGFRVEIIEAQLAHSVRDSLGRAYNRTKFENERRQMMQAWSDYIFSLEG
ncbi:MAG: Prophage integrase IntA [Dehalococcoidia bacterium]|nr:Prophage integrase IntA [Chloroflexota bacterium]